MLKPSCDLPIISYFTSIAKIKIGRIIEGKFKSKEEHNDVIK
ncbi:hypothetical protein SAMN05421578_10533 [Paenibacillus macquariensis]|uniref:Uncharacterized protein n=1 Tax=Paenibacillus macquariensis TaxID=948756 RepID=A0ABY1JWR9_9BACL|nr:hypothetical protein SAMN05421578_10533 [Paenibacillus macquariensis]